MNRRQWLGFAAATMPLLCLPVPVAGAITAPTPKHPHDALLHRLGYTNAKQRLIRYVSVQHGKLVDADFEQPAPFYDRVLTFWDNGGDDVWVVMDYVGTDEKLLRETPNIVDFGFPRSAVARLEEWPYDGCSDVVMTPTPEHPHAEWMRRNLGVQGAVLVSLDERPLRLVGLPTSALSTTVWRDRNNGDEATYIVRERNGAVYESIYFAPHATCGFITEHS